MDPTANNTGPVNPNNPNVPPTDPPAGTGPAAAGGEPPPDHGAEVAELKGWFRENAVSLLFTVAAIVAVCVWLDPWDTFKVVVGLGFIIFIHELGHFLAAKWRDVHVRTFSIGFGPAVPFCSYKWGETTYMIGIIPLGGYVAMVGEGEGAENDEEAEEDPRSFRKKKVWERMVIISAGVIMNVIFGLACFTAAYLHGVQEKPAVVGHVESGGGAWRAGMRTGDRITKLDTRDNPFFDDIRPKVMSAGKGEQLDIQWERNGTPMPETKITPIRDEGQKFPQIGVAPPSQLTLFHGAKRKVKPYMPGSPAAEATGPNGEKFEPGDRILKMTDPDRNGELTPVADFNEYHRRMVKAAAAPITFEVQRKDSEEKATITVKPAYRRDLGMRMRMGEKAEVAALRKGGPAEKAGIVAHADGPEPVRGDRIKAVMLPEAGKGQTWYVAGSVDSIPGVDSKKMPDVNVEQLDPLLLPHQLNAWVERRREAQKGEPLPRELPMELVVSRAAHPTDKPVRVALNFDTSFRFDRETVFQPNSPMPLSGLGLAYWVETIVDDVPSDGPAKAAGVLPNDQIVAVQFKAHTDAGPLKDGPWNDELKNHQWASVDSLYQLPGSAAEINIKVKRNDKLVEQPITITGQPSKWALDDRGLSFMPEFQVQRATDVGDAMRLGGLRTLRFIKTVYMNLYGYITNRISVKTLSGPLTIANVSYKLAGEDFWQFLLFLGMISVNLAVVNFLPIPVLDGGHMVFLIYEKVTGKPVPERLFAILMYAGLFLILALMVFVLFLDAGRLFFNMF